MVDFEPWLDNSANDSIGPNMDFSYVVDGKKVYFLNETRDGSSFIWDMGDFTNHNKVNPLHVYQKPGDFFVGLEATGTKCKITQITCKKVSVKGISSFSPFIGGNSGTVTLNIAAGGLDEQSQICLTNSGSGEIFSESVALLNDGSAIVRFNLDDVEVGNRRIRINYGDGTEAYSETFFEIQQAEKGEPWIQVLGRDAALINVWQSYEIKFGNSGNVDMYGVPLWFSFSEIPGIEVQFLNFEFTPSEYAVSQGYDATFFEDMDIYLVVDSMFGESSYSRVYQLYIPMIPAGREFSLKMKIKSPQNFEFQAWLNDPYFSSPFNGRYIACLTAVIGERVIKLVPGADCASAIVGSIFKPLAGLKGSTKVFVTPGIWDLWQIGWECRLSFTGAIGIAKNVIDLVVNFKDDVQALLDCKKNFDPKHKKKKEINVVQSFDPNEKVGPVGVDVSEFIPYHEKMSYTIFFENDPDSAQVPAHTVVVVDTLDKSIFDLQSFEFNDITIGDTVPTALPGSNTFGSEMYLGHLGVMAKVHASLDTLTGVVQWKFISLDSVTGAEIEDPFVGFTGHCQDRVAYNDQG